jgi:hypothetical protein
MGKSSFEWVDSKDITNPTGRIFYNVEMAKVIRNIKPPYKGIVVDIRARPNYLALTVYEENIMEFSVDQRVNIMEWLLLIRSTIQSYGVRCELEGATGNVRRK